MKKLQWVNIFTCNRTSTIGIVYLKIRFEYYLAEELHKSNVPTLDEAAPLKLYRFPL